MKLKDKIRWLLSTGYKKTGEIKPVGYEVIKKSFPNTSYGSIRSVMSRLVALAYTERIETPDGVYYRLTTAGWESFKMDFRQLEKVGVDYDDQKWLILFNIPERKRQLRDFLREQIKKDGFLPLGRSMYVKFGKPGRFVIRMLSEQKYKTLVWMGQVSEEVIGSLGEVVRKQLNYEQIYAAYLSFISRADGVIGVMRVEKDPNRWESLVFEAMEDFYKAIDMDVGIPDQVWGDKNMFIEAWKRYKELVKIIES